MAINTQPPTALGAIQTAAKARGLAWQPLAAVAHFESGLNPQSIGDGGHAFGLFQNNNAGGTITGDPNPRRFLNPNVSANYTADAIKRLGIQGMSPQAQVAAIVNRYERPANPGREIAGAQSYLATLGGVAPATPQGPGPTAQVSLAAPQQSLSSLSLAPLQQSLTLGAAQSQRAQDALAKLSGHSVEAQAAPDLSTLMAQQPAVSGIPDKPQHVQVPLSQPTPKGVDPQAAKAIELAKHYLGSAYVYGGASPKTGFDCSGLLQYVWGQNGVKIPRTAAEQYHAGKPVAANQLQAGDALYFQTEGAQNGVTHAAMYIGNGQILESPHTGDVVKIAPLAGYYQQHLVGARRFA